MTEATKLQAIVYMDQKNIFDDFKRLDYCKLLSFIKSKYNVMRATSFYALDMASKEDDNFILKLIDCGWRCETNVESISTNGIITTNLVNDKLHSDHKVVVVLSGHRELDYPLDFLAKAGYKIHIIGCKDKISINLKKVADEITYLEDIDVIIPKKIKK